MEKKNSIGNPLKSFSILLVAQLTSILTGVVRTKIIAVFWGPSGVGILGILQTTMDLAFSITNCGISTSAVREIAASENLSEKKAIAIIFKKLSLFTGIVGTLLILCFAPFLSQLTFGDKNFSIAYSILSFYIIIRSINSLHLSILQGFHEIKLYANANVLGAILSLIIIIPIILFCKKWGESLLLLSVTVASTTASLIYYSKFSNRNSVKLVQLNFGAVSKKLLKTGISLTIGGSILSVIVSLITRTFINTIGSIQDVGLYQAGWTIVNSYVGVFFVVMSTDYYPKLSSVIYNRSSTNKIYNQQILMSMALLLPCLILLILFLPLIVSLLYTKDFTLIIPFVKLSLLGVLFKAISYSISYVFLAKSSIKIYFLTELFSNILFIILNLLLYKYMGLLGMGISYTLGYLITLLIVLYFLKKVSFVFLRKRTSKVIWGSISLFLLALFFDICMTGFYRIIFLTILLLLSFVFSLKILGLKIRHY